MSKVFQIIIICILFSCGKIKEEQSNASKVIQNTILITKADIDKLDYKEFVLDVASEKNIFGWFKYEELEYKINEIKNGDLSHFKSDKEIVETLMNEFTNTVPLNINENAIQARVLIVETMYLKLNNIINLPTSSKRDIKEAITDMLESFSNLNYQINKKFERDSQNVTKPE